MSNGPTAPPQPEAAWGVDSEHGRLLDVLVCPPELPLAADQRDLMRDPGEREELRRRTGAPPARRHGRGVLYVAEAGALNAAMRARGLTVRELDVSMFTLGGGGARCLAQALRRERLTGA